MTRSFFLLPLVVLLVVSVNAQQLRTPVVLGADVNPSKATKGEVHSVSPSLEHHPDLLGTEWNFYIRNIEEKESINPQVEAIKNSYPSKHTNVQVESRADETNSANLSIGQHYDANPFDGSYPPDNAIAISGTGWVVSITNSIIRYYNAAGQQKLNKSIEDFVNDFDASPLDIIFDPRVIFDSGSNRFIMCELSGSTSSTAKILMLFSKTDNPQDGWNYYNIPVISDFSGVWADFPSIGVSNNEAYVTVNLFSNSGNFNKVAVYQLDKNAGYSNSTLNYQTWTDLSDDLGAEPFTLVPVSYGHDGNYGPGIYFVSTPDPGSGNHIQVFDLTNDMSASNEQFNGYHASIPNYQIGGNAIQPSGQDLDIGDSRMKSAFYLNNTIHCVFTISINSQGYNGINYSRIDMSGIAGGALTATNKKLSQTNVDLAYPSVASFATGDTDPTVVIYYERSSSTLNPSCNAVICDAAQNFGTSLSIKDGTNIIDVEPDNTTYERWGDYSGISRKSGTTVPTVWVFGTYGKAGDVYGNNVCELIDNGVVSVSEPKINSSEVNVYPNPAQKYFTLKFESDEEQQVDIALYDVAGKELKHLATKALRDGKYEFGFNCESLPAGAYFLRISSINKTLANEKIVVQ